MDYKKTVGECMEDYEKCGATIVINDGEISPCEPEGDTDGSV